MHPLTRRCCSHGASGSLLIIIPWAAARQRTSPTPPISLSRHKHHAASASKKTIAASHQADAVVVGGGAAGIAVVGNLLENSPAGKVVWIDKSFEGGSIGQLYREVPSYSPAGDFVEYARALETFRDICDAAPQPNALTVLQGLDLEMTCPLNHAADMLKLVSDGLLKHERVKAVLGNVTQAVRSPKTKRWTVTLHPPTPGRNPTPVTYSAPLVVYCTGTRPTMPPLPLPISQLSLPTALAPSRLAKLLPAAEPRTVAVIGADHAAVLALRNLFRLAAVSHRRLRVRWIARSPHLTYAQLREDDGAVLNERDGLMGEAAAFARTHLEGDALARGDAGGFIERVVLPPLPAWGGGLGFGAVGDRQRAVLEGLAVAEHLEGVDYVVQSVGFERARLPEVKPGLGMLGGLIGRPKKLVFDGLRGSFFPSVKSRDRVIGLFGAGSAFPEYKVTAEGWRKPEVGLWKFMDFAQRMVPRWVEATKKGVFAPSWSETEAAVTRRQRHHEFY